MRRAAEDGLVLLRGFTPEKMRALVADAMEPVLRPLVYDEPLHLLRGHRERGERVYIVSATLQEIVEHIADDLGFDSALGTVCEVRDGVYTPRGARCTRTRRAAFASSPSTAASISPSARPTPTVTPICRSSMPSGILS